MSRIVVLGAAGTAGSRITAEALGRGHEAVPVVRDTSKVAMVAGVPTVVGDATDTAAVTRLAEGADALVIAVGSAWAQAAEAALASGTYIVHMGGGATLTTPDGTMFLDRPQFPAEFRVPARGQAEALEVYRAQGGDARWTYVSPPPVDFAVGERTGSYRTGDDQPVADENGHARISYEDFAVAVVDEVERPAHAGRRFTVGY